MWARMQYRRQVRLTGPHDKCRWGRGGWSMAHYHEGLSQLSGKEKGFLPLPSLNAMIHQLKSQHAAYCLMPGVPLM